MSWQRHKGGLMITVGVPCPTPSHLQPCFLEEADSLSVSSSWVGVLLNSEQANMTVFLSFIFSWENNLRHLLTPFYERIGFSRPSAGILLMTGQRAVTQLLLEYFQRWRAYYSLLTGSSVVPVLILSNGFQACFSVKF